MHTLRLSLMTFATVISIGTPASALACGPSKAMEGSGYMMTPVSMMGRFVFINRISRRSLRQAVAEQQINKSSAPLLKAIL